MSKALTNIATYLSNSKKNMSRILSATSTESAAKLHRALATESEAETLSCSFQSSSSPTVPGANVFSRAVLHGGHFSISINTVNQPPDAYSLTRKHTFKRFKRILAQVTQALWEIYRPCDLCSALCECCNMSVTAAVA